ncbi:MAG: diguanylate cyclase [Deltaproteobacteria bacterium]|nr:diguanylate cyclase [Deltaproteobacteria bacterium]
MTSAPAFAARPPKQRASRPLSLVATRIVQLALDESVELAALARLAETDPGFAARIVRAVNGGAYGLSQRVTDLKRAASLLGTRGLRNIALGLIVSDMAPAGNAGTLLLSSSLRRGVAARLVAQALRDPQPDEHFTVGLFLEIALLQLARLNPGATVEICRMPAQHRVTFERSLGGPGHPTAGADVARHLGLTEEMVTAIENHHAPAPPADRLSRTAWVAERLAGAFEGVDPQRTRELALSAATAVGVDLQSARAILAQVPELVAQAAQGFDRDVPAQESIDALVADAHQRLVEMNSGYERLIRQLEQLLTEKEKLEADLRRANAELETAAASDPLTGLPNRRAFDDAIRRDFARAERSGGVLAVVAVDVDHFKRVNDTFGHATGDAVLRQVAEVLRGALRTGDFPARIGGEEFVAILPGADAAGAKIVADRVRVALARTQMPGPSGPFSVTASFGVAAVAGKALRAGGAAALARADQALYTAKATGRNRVVIAE